MLPLGLATQSYSVCVTLLKEYAYCPLIAYHKIFSIMEPPTESMRYAKEKLDRGVVEFKLKAAGVDGSFLWNVPVKSKSLGVRGVADLVVVKGLRAWVVEVKLETSRRKLWARFRHHLVQALAYAVAVEETLKVVVEEIILVPLERGGIVRVRVTPHLRSYVARLAAELRAMVEGGAEPRGAVEKGKCRSCYYKRLCSQPLLRLTGDYKA